MLDTLTRSLSSFCLITAVMHRDLSTRNVLVHSLHEDQVLEVWVKVSDFGLSCLADSSLESIAVRRDRCLHVVLPPALYS